MHRIRRSVSNRIPLSGMTLEALRLRVATRQRAKERFHEDCGREAVLTREHLSDTERKQQTNGTVDTTYKTLLQCQEKVSILSAQGAWRLTGVVVQHRHFHQPSRLSTACLLNPKTSRFTRYPGIAADSCPSPLGDRTTRGRQAPQRAFEQLQENSGSAATSSKIKSLRRRKFESRAVRKRDM